MLRKTLLSAFATVGLLANSAASAIMLTTTGIMVEGGGIPMVHQLENGNLDGKTEHAANNTATSVSRHVKSCE